MQTFYQPPDRNARGSCFQMERPVTSIRPGLRSRTCQGRGPPLSDVMRVLLATWGSQGDFYPFLALARRLRKNGHTVTLIGPPGSGNTAERAGVRFRASFREGHDFLHRLPEVINHRWNGLPSLYQLVHKCLRPTLRETYEVLMEEAVDHDLVVAHPMVYPAGMVCEQRRLPWVTACLIPGITPSSYYQSGTSFFRTPRSWLNRQVCAANWKLGEPLVGGIVDPVINDFRQTMGLPARANHFFGSRSADLILDLYSPCFMPPAPDWKSSHYLAGFCFNDFGAHYQPSEELARFLDAGPKPLLFTLGSMVVDHPGTFFHEAIRSLEGTDHRAILLTGTRTAVERSPSERVLLLASAPHDWLMPRCQAVAHQCGIGTLAEALRAGIPSVGCPHAFDQPNNAVRMQELGAGVFLRPGQFKADSLRQAFQQAINCSPADGARFQQLSAHLRDEDGPGNAVQALEQYYLSKRCP